MFFVRKGRPQREEKNEKKEAELESKYGILVKLKKLQVEIPIPRFLHFVVFKSQSTSFLTKWVRNKGTWVTQGREEHRRGSGRWDKVLMKFIRPVGQRTVAEVGHVSATRLVC